MRESIPGFSPEKLRQARLVAGYTPEQLAGLAGCSRTAVRVWESGEYGPTPPRAKAVAEVFGKTIGDFVDFSPENASLRQLRALTGRTQRDMRSLPGLHDLGAMERGSISVPDAIVSRLADEYGVDVEIVRRAAERTRQAEVERLRAKRTPRR